MTLTAQPKAVSPAVDAVRYDLRAYLNRSDLFHFEYVPPEAIVAGIAKAWQREGGTESGFIGFVNLMLAGTGWVADDAVTAYLGDDKSPRCRIVLHRDI